VPSLRIIKIKKEQKDVVGGLPTVLGLRILQLLSNGYKKFVIEDLGDYIEVKTWRIRKRAEVEE